MNYKNIETALKETFKISGFNQYFDVGFDYLDFEDSYGLTSQLVCISYNGIESINTMENIDISINENVSVFIKYFGNFNDFRDMLKTLINDSRKIFMITDERYVIQLENGSLSKLNDYFIATLNYTVVGLC